jgi:hypothetical protein
MKTLFAASGCASTRRLVTLGLALAAAAVSLAAAPAHAQSCQDLWTERNGYYQANGYCFKTARAIRYFGNGGCNPRLTEGSVRARMVPSVRARVDEIARLERRLGCND